MMTAVDTNILLDVLIPAAPFGAASQQSLDTALQQGTLVLNEMVYAELAAHFPTLEERRCNSFLSQGIGEGHDRGEKVWLRKHGFRSSMQTRTSSRPNAHGLSETRRKGVFGLSCPPRRRPQPASTG